MLRPYRSLPRLTSLGCVRQSAFPCKFARHRARIILAAVDLMVLTLAPVLPWTAILAAVQALIVARALVVRLVLVVA
jgi:hypothetical protein